MNTTSETTPTPPYTPPATIRIDGAKIKTLREQQGLTQLYISTVVGVTTDTISRWENRRYQTIKLTNAEKLARALEVTLADIEDKTAPDAAAHNHAETSAPEKSAAGPTVLRSTAALVAIILVLIALAAYLIQPRSSGTGQAVPVTATRILPPHAPAGSSFPVILRINTPGPSPATLIIREAIPTGATAESGVPAITSRDPKNGSLKWLSKTAGPTTLYAYRCRLPATTRNEFSFDGTVTVKQKSGQAEKIGGDTTVTAAPYHWADTNRDNVIDDEEILTVYDRYSEIRGFDFGLDKIDDIWAMGGYTWDPEQRIFKVRE